MWNITDFDGQHVTPPQKEGKKNTFHFVVHSLHSPNYRHNHRAINNSSPLCYAERSEKEKKMSKKNSDDKLNISIMKNMLYAKAFAFPFHSRNNWLMRTIMHNEYLRFS